MPPSRARRRLLGALLLALLVLAPVAAQAQSGGGEEETPVEGLPDLDATPMPDLIGANLNVFPDQPHEAQETRLCADVRNIGDADAANPFDTIFLIDGIDEGGIRSQDTVRQGHALTLCRNFTIPAGHHQFTVRVDVSGGERGEVLESNETNNQPTLRRFYISSEPRPDLQVTSATVFPRVSRDGEPQAFAATISNVGRLPSNATHVDILDESGRIAPPYPVPALEPGDSFEVAVLTRPEYRRPGNFTVQFVLDPNGVVLEEREDNNYQQLDYVISEHPQPDLLLTHVALDGKQTERHPLRMDIRIENQGTQAMRREGLAVLLSKDDEDNVRTLGNRTFPLLHPGEGANLSFSFTLSAGNHTLRVRLDPRDVELEKNETNNHDDTNVTIAPPERVHALPNLVMQALDAAPDDPTPTEVVTLTALVANLGDETARDVTVEFFADGDSVGTATIRTLGPDQQTTVSVPWKPDAYREYALVAQADPEAVVDEYVEEDNMLARTLLVRDPTGGNGAPPATPPPTGGSPDGGSGTPPTDGDGDGDGDGSPGGTDGDTTEPPPEAERRPAEIGGIDVTTSPQPGKLVGKIDVTLRNPNLDAINSLTVKFLVDGQPLKEILVRNVPSAATRVVTSGDVELPSGKHIIGIEVAQPGRSEVVRSETEYDAVALEDGVPAPGVALALVAVALAGFARRADEWVKQQRRR